MRELSWNEVQLLRGLIFKELDQPTDELTKKDLMSSLEKLNEQMTELGSRQKNADLQR